MNQSRSFVKSFWRILSIWAVSLGCSVGWGAFVMPGTMFLPLAGPLGTMIAMVFGALVMIVIAANFHNLMNRSSHTGGVFAYTREVFSYDHSLMCVWSVVLAYISILWANATAIPLISRVLFGNIFQFGFKYTFFGYDVYFGECLITIAAIVLFGLLTARNMRFTRILQTLLALILFAGVLVCFFLAFAKTGFSMRTFKPFFSGNGMTPVAQVINIAWFTPWAFLGFCTVSLLPGRSEFADGTFPRKKSFMIMASAILAGMIIYILLALFATLSLPKGCDTWRDYVTRLSSFNGFTRIPVLNAAQKLLGKGGIILMSVCVASGIFTGIIGMYRAAARLFISLAEDDVLPAWFGKVTAGIPTNAIHFIMLISLVIPFLGRTAIGWIVDVLSITAAIAYAYVSAASLKIALREKQPLYRFTGIVGLLSSVFFFIPLIPNSWSANTLAPESYLVLLIWAVVGLVLFRFVFIRDKNNRFGHSTIMWIAMLTIVLLSSMMWIRQGIHAETENIIQNIALFHKRIHMEENIPMTAVQIASEHDFMENQMRILRNSRFLSSLFQFAVVIFSLFVMFNIFSTQQKREKKLSLEKGIAEQANRAKSTFLSNMSHDIRTPMNAIIGFTNLALKNPEVDGQTREYLSKIKASSDHLLSLINDVLEMSRIESGKIELDEIPCSISEILSDLNTIIIGQVTAKKQELSMEKVNVIDEKIICDKLRLNQILLNLLSNATKYTPSGGKISLRVLQTGREKDRACYEIRVRDNGIGMSAKFAERVFEAFEREKNSTVSGIQGTGLGMAITKQLVELMGGSIRVETEEGKGTEFIMTVAFMLQEELTKPGHEEEKTSGKIDTAAQMPEEKPFGHEAEEGDGVGVNFSGKRLLLVDDVDVNREIAAMLLEMHGFEVEKAVNGYEALLMVSNVSPSYFD
ncbi:MAG: amino acid permease, partial [Treponema sp.]|nr:amino acid permease [Treponema sp.]